MPTSHTHCMPYTGSLACFHCPAYPVHASLTPQTASQQPQSKTAATPISRPLRTLRPTACAVSTCSHTTCAHYRGRQHRPACAAVTRGPLPQKRHEQNQGTFVPPSISRRRDVRRCVALLCSMMHAALHAVHDSCATVCLRGSCHTPPSDRSSTSQPTTAALCSASHYTRCTDIAHACAHATAGAMRLCDGTITVMQPCQPLHCKTCICACTASTSHCDIASLSSHHSMQTTAPVASRHHATVLSPASRTSK